MSRQAGFSKIALVLLLAVLLGAVGYYFFVRLSGPRIPAGYKPYVNAEHGFSLQIPGNLVAITQNETPSYSDYLFVDSGDLAKIQNDPQFKTNPFLVALTKHIPGLHLYRNASAWVASAGDGVIRTYLTSPAGGPEGEVEVKLKEYEKIASRKGQVIYLYKTEIQSTPAVTDAGALWITDGILYDLKNLSRDELPGKDTFRAIAENFSVNK